MAFETVERARRPETFMNALQASRLVDLGETRYDGQNMLLRGAGSHESPHRSLRIDL